jgi:hypothetical protein
MTLFSSLYGARLDEELGTDDSTVLFTTARRKSAINRGLEEFAKLTECWQRSSTLTITGGTAEYDLSTLADFVRLSKQQVEFHYVDASSVETVLAGDDLIRRDIDWLNRYNSGWQSDTTASSVQQLPTQYYERLDGGARYLGLVPKPCTGSSASAKVVVPYVARPTPMTSDTAEPFSTGAAVRADLRPYHQASVHYAAHQLEKLRRDDAASDRQLQKFLGYVSSWWAENRPKGGRALTQARNYFQRRNADKGVDPRV